MWSRITIEPEKMGGVPCVRGLRIPVTTIARMIEDGLTVEEILDAYPDLEREDIDEAIAYRAAHPDIEVFRL